MVGAQVASSVRPVEDRDKNKCLEMRIFWKQWETSSGI